MVLLFSCDTTSKFFDNIMTSAIAFNAKKICWRKLIFNMISTLKSQFQWIVNWSVISHFYTLIYDTFKICCIWLLLKTSFSCFINWYIKFFKSFNTIVSIYYFFQFVYNQSSFAFAFILITSFWNIFIWCFIITILYKFSIWIIV